MRLFSVSIIAVSLLTISSVSFAQTSYQNSPNNYQNSPNNYRNSPNNYIRTGYSVQRQDGSGTNIYDNQGNRTGYTNRRR